MSGFGTAGRGNDELFNTRLGAAIACYWAERGFKVSFQIVEEVKGKPGFPPTFGLRTDMVNGQPTARLQHDGRRG